MFEEQLLRATNKTEKITIYEVKWHVSESKGNTPLPLHFRGWRQEDWIQGHFQLCGLNMRTFTKQIVLHNELIECNKELCQGWQDGLVEKACTAKSKVECDS